MLTQKYKYTWLLIQNTQYSQYSFPFFSILNTPLKGLKWQSATFWRFLVCYITYTNKFTMFPRKEEKQRGTEDQHWSYVALS